MNEEHLLVSVAQKALIEVEGKILLMHGKEPWWELPGGRVNVGEKDLGESLKRELKEELNLDIEPGSLVSASLYTSRSNKEFLILVYRCRLLSDLDQVIPQEGEVGGWGWFQIQEVKDLQMHPAFKEVLFKISGLSLDID